MIWQKCAGFWSVSEKLDYFCPVYFVAMKRLIIGALICACAFLIVHAAPQAPATRKPLTIEQLIDIRHPSNAMWSPDGRHVVFVWDRAGVSNVYVSDLTVSAPRELKDAGASLNGAFWTSDGRALMIPKDGDLWRVPIDGSAASAVWTTPQQESSIVASPDRTRVAFVRSNAGRGSELWIRSLSDGRESLVVRADDTMMSGVGWSPDAESLVFTYGGSTIRHEQTPQYSGTKIIYTINENVPGQTMVIPAEAPAARASGSGAPLAEEKVAPKPIAGGGGFGGRRWLDARHFVVDRTSPDFKRRTTALVDIAGGEPKVLHEDVEEKFWSMTGDANGGAQPSPDGKWIAFLSDRDGWDHLYVMPASGGVAVQITKGSFEAWRPTWSSDSTRIAFDANLPDRYGMRHLFVAMIDGNPSRAKIIRVTSGRGTNIAPQWSPDGTRLMYQHTDPQNSADLYVVDAEPTATSLRLTDSMPATIHRSAVDDPEVVHYAGPDGRQVPAWLLVPNNLDRSKKHPAIVWIHGDGGFFTLIAVTDQPKLFRAAVDVAGVVDYAMYYEDPYHGGWTTSRIGTPDQNPNVYAQASPLSHVDRLERPLLVLHGTSDVNVPYLHSVRLLDELMKQGKGDLVSFMTYPGEFHYFTREHVLRDAWHRVEDFFDEHLKGRGITSH